MSWIFIPWPRKADKPDVFYQCGHCEQFSRAEDLCPACEFVLGLTTGQQCKYLYAIEAEILEVQIELWRMQLYPRSRNS